MSRHFDVAPWPASLRLISVLGMIGLLGASVAAYHVIPAASGFTHGFGLGLALVPLFVLAGGLFSVVSGYTLDPTRLEVHRLLTSTVIPLAGIERAWADPAACKGSLRVFGNGGLFSFTGSFYSRHLGRYRAFVTDFRSAVVLRFRDRVVVISPAAPRAFIQYLAHVHPEGLKVEPGKSA